MQFPLGKIAFSLLPLSPESVGRRKTLLKEIIKDRIWTLDQIQGVINVNVPVRSTIIKLSSGGLFINNPVAPTEECISYVRKLEQVHGPVRFIVLSSLALEHKGTTGAFARYFPSANIYLQPGQYSVPINLPSQLYFPFGRKLNYIPANSKDAPWYADIDHEIVGPLLPPTGVGGYAETAFFHRSTKTLLVTDSIIKVTDDAPDIVQEDPRALLYHARNTMLDVVVDNAENRRKGWRRMVLFGLVFQPTGIEVKEFSESFKIAQTVDPEMKKLGEGAIPFAPGLYPWDWIEDEKKSFESLKGGLLVAPILQKLIFNREPAVVAEWVNNVSKWPFERIIPCHFANDVRTTPREFKQAFDFLYEKKKSNLLTLFLNGNNHNLTPQPLEKEVQFLSDVSKQLTKQGVLKEEASLLAR
eukprot:gene5653-7807_t